MSEATPSTTLWMLAQTWKCEFADVTQEREGDGGKKLSLTVRIHLDGCRKCALEKHLLKIDEQLKQIVERDYDEFCTAFPAAAEELTDEEYGAIQDHAATVREQMIGAPQ